MHARTTHTHTLFLTLSHFFSLSVSLSLCLSLSFSVSLFLSFTFYTLSIRNSNNHCTPSYQQCSDVINSQSWTNKNNNEMVPIHIKVHRKRMPLGPARHVRAQSRHAKRRRGRAPQPRSPCQLPHRLACRVMVGRGQSARCCNVLKLRTDPMKPKSASRCMRLSVYKVVFSAPRTTLGGGGGGGGFNILIFFTHF